MAQSQTPIVQAPTLATSADVKSILGNLDEAKTLAILDLQPTTMDLEQASIALSGDTDIYGAGEPMKTVAGEIIALLTADEEDERGG